MSCIPVYHRAAACASFSPVTFHTHSRPSTAVMNACCTNNFCLLSRLGCESFFVFACFQVPLRVRRLPRIGPRESRPTCGSSSIRAPTRSPRSPCQLGLAISCARTSTALAQRTSASARRVTGSPPEGPSLEDLEAGRSGDTLWDDCQQCRNYSGELHNNVRMAWGKATPHWHAAALRAATAAAASTDVLGAPRPPPSAAQRLQAALDLLVRLNDKFALDGGAPPSYGGLLWCLGWRDRPGDHGCPTKRPTRVMASKIRPVDLERRAMRSGGVAAC